MAIVQELAGTPLDPSEIGVLERLVRRVIAEQHDLTVHDVFFARKATLPRTSSGKLQRNLILAQLLAGTLTPATQSVSEASVAREPRGARTC